MTTATSRTSPGGSGPDIATQPVQNVADLRTVHQEPVVAGLINEYHHAA